VFLKSLTLKGFKSFADPTTLTLEPGVTVVVGPNGSGKSNVVDAIAWVLGAQAPKAVRSQKMDDVIFAGTAKRPALGRAEVALTIDNSAGLLGVEFSEVTVSRILFRSGDSEYSINGVSCRLLDVQELLSDAGVGRQQHVIVSQGQIDAVLNARPEDRRSIIEEAAGVLKFRKRREKAERRLESTEANLLRLQDLLREVRRQLRPLARQAEAAQRHGELITELTALRLFVAGREIAALRTRGEVLAIAHIEAEKSEADLKTLLLRLDTEIQALEAQLTAHGVTDLTDRLRQVEQLRERSRGLSAVVTERRRSMERDRGQLLDEGVIASLEGDLAQMRAEVSEVAIEANTLEPEAAGIMSDEEALAEERARFEQNRTDLDPTGASAAKAAAEVRGELRSARSAAERSDSELRRATEALARVATRVEELATKVDRARTHCAEAEAVEAPLVVEVEQAETARRSAEAALEQVSAHRLTVSDALSRASARVEALQMALDAAHARAGAERLAGVSGVLGTLLDLVEIDQGWESAVEASLGEALSAVVVDSATSAKEALRALRESDTSGAVLALGTARTAGRAGSPSHASPSDGEPVRPRVRSGRADVAQLLDYLIGDAICVEEMSAAVEVALAAPNLTVVTRGGDRLGPTGWRVGAAGSGVTAAALADAQQSDAELSAQMDRVRTEMRTAEEQLARLRAVETELVARLDANDARFMAASDVLTRAQTERREADAERERLETSVADLRGHVDSQRERIASLETLLPDLDADENAEREAARARGEARAALEARAAVLASRRRDLEVRNAGLIERHQFLERRIAETEARLQADTEARAAAADRRVAIERALRAVDSLGAIVDVHRVTVEAEYQSLSAQRQQHSEAVRALNTDLEQHRRNRAQAERDLEAVRETTRRTELEHTEVKLRLETAIETVRRDLEVEPEIAVQAPEPPVPEGTTPVARVRDLDRELRLMGPINPLALEEFNELQQRHNFLEEQLEDVRTSRRELSRVITAIDNEIQSVFTSAFTDVAANFTQLFSTLFPGGAGKLTLTVPDDMLNTGIEVEAKPSGKNVKKLSLLSGGERSLTALAFLFAVFRSRPSPFYVMDEVEAALDDVNLHRFLGLVAEFRKEAQLLIVSHQKRTMEAGDCLVGVSMQPGGSSKVVTERAGATSD
jgi:chromosome segregation protein